MMDCRNPERDLSSRKSIVARAEDHPEAAPARRRSRRRRRHDKGGHHETHHYSFAAAALLAARRSPLVGAVAGARDRLRLRDRTAEASRTTSISAKWPASRPTRRATSSSTRAPAIRRSRSARARPFAHGGSRLFQFDQTGKFVREIGQGVYGFLFAQQVRVDPQDNIWIVDQMSNMVIKFDSDGQCADGARPQAGAKRFRLAARRRQRRRRRRLRRRRWAAAGGRGAAAPQQAARARRRRAGCGRPAVAADAVVLPERAAQQDVFNRPTDVAWDAAGNIYVADGFGNNADREVRQERQVRQVVGPDRHGAGSVPAAARHRHRRAGQRLRRRRRQQAHPGVRRRRHLQVADS